MSRDRRSPLVTVALVVVSTGAGVGIGWVAYSTTTRPHSAPVARAPHAPSASAAAGSASPSATPPAAVGACPRPGTENACLASLFPPGTFRPGKAVDLSFICREDNPVRGGGAIRSAVVRSAGNEVTGAMRQWATLGWYELPAFAAMRARCCPDPPPLVIPPHPPTCGSVGESLPGLAAATADPALDEAARSDALAAYTASVTCLTKARAHKAFGQPGGPDGGASTAYRAVMAKIAGAAACDAAPAK